MFLVYWILGKGSDFCRDADVSSVTSCPWEQRCNTFFSSDRYEIITRSRRSDMQVRWIMQLPAPLFGPAVLYSEMFYYADVARTVV